MMIKEMTVAEEVASAKRSLVKMINGVRVFTGGTPPARFEPVFKKADDALSREDATAEELRSCAAELFAELGKRDCLPAIQPHRFSARAL